jgi:hypothetical protein
MAHNGLTVRNEWLRDTKQLTDGCATFEGENTLRKLTLLILLVNIRTSYFNFNNSAFSAQHVYGLLMVLRVNSAYVLKQH